MNRASKVLAASLIASLSLIAQQASAQSFKLGIMQAQKGDAAKFGALGDYLKTKGVTVELVGFANYADAAKQFADGKVDGMVAGSGVAGTMLIKGLADPLVRPVNKAGWSTYHAAVIAPVGSPKFKNDGAYFNGKKVICSSLASAGEFFARAMGKKDPMPAANHGAALDALNAGMADIAIVKNRVWESSKAKYPKLEMVGEDTGDNPDNTLIVGKKVAKDLVEKIKAALLAIKGESGAEAKAAKDALEITEYIPTTEADFAHNKDLLKKAGVTKDFNFSF